MIELGEDSTVEFKMASFTKKGVSTPRRESIANELAALVTAVVAHLSLAFRIVAMFRKCLERKWMHWKFSSMKFAQIVFDRSFDSLLNGSHCQMDFQ